MTDLLAAIADERRRIADLVDSLSADQLATPSLCRDWTVKDVAGHLLAAVAAPGYKLPLLTVTSGFSLHKANARLAREMAARSPSSLAEKLRGNATNPVKPPVVGHQGQLTDLQVHGQDMRRPLGLPSGLHLDRLRVSLDFLVGGRAIGFTTRSRLAGLGFEATDLDWRWGSGPVVAGPAEALMMAMTGRLVALGDLDGDGVRVLKGRI
jgi:uncharacterized protein (TIGR03083 family)